ARTSSEVFEHLSLESARDGVAIELAPDFVPAPPLCHESLDDGLEDLLDSVLRDGTRDEGQNAEHPDPANHAEWSPERRERRDDGRSTGNATGRDDDQQNQPGNPERHKLLNYLVHCASPLLELNAVGRGRLSTWPPAPQAEQDPLRCASSCAPPDPASGASPQCRRRSRRETRPARRLSSSAPR